VTLIVDMDCQFRCHLFMDKIDRKFCFFFTFKKIKVITNCYIVKSVH